MTKALAKQSARPTLGHVAARATASPLNVGVAAAGTIAAVALASWPIFAIGAVAYAALVAWDVVTPQFWQEVYATPEPVSALPPLDKLADPATRDAVGQLTAARKALDETLAETPPDVIAHLATTLASLRELDGHAARLVVRAEDIARHLGLVNVAALEADGQKLAARARTTTDATAKASFEQAGAARADAIATIRELERAKDRIDGNLMRLVAMMSGLPTKVVQMRALDAETMDELSGNVADELEAMGNEIKTSEEIMKSIGEVTKS
jgi:hypothetical protein